MKGIYFNGRRVIRPQAVSKIDDTGMYGRGLGGGNTLAIIGEATGGEPGKVLWFTDPGTAKATLRSGNLLTAIQRAYDPSSFAGAYQVAAIRVNHFTDSSNACVQATQYLKDIYGVNIILLTSVDYGAWNNQIKVKVETGTLHGKKLTITYGSEFEQGDNIWRESFALGCADPMATAATVTINKASGLLTTAVTATPQTLIAGTKDAVSFNTTLTNAGGPYALNVNGTDKVYIGSSIPFNAANFTISVANDQAFLLTNLVKYWNGASWVAVSGMSDTTVSVGCTFAQSGSVSFTLPTAWQHSASATGAPAYDLYWLQITSTGALKGTTAASAITLTRQPLSVTLASYPYIQNLVDYIDASYGYETDAVTTAPTTDLSTELDDVIAASFRLLPTYYTSGTTNLLVGNSTGYAVGDRIVISQINPTSYPSEEIRTVSAVPDATHITVSAALGLTYQANDPIRKCLVLQASSQAMVDWVNDNSAWLTAAYVAGATDSVANISDTYMTGGSDGTTLQADWDAALELLQVEDTPLVTCVSYDPSVWASLSTHVDYMSTVGKKERRGFCGGFATVDGYTTGLGKWANTVQIAASVEQMLTYATELNSDRMYYVGPGFIAYDENGLRTTYPGSIAAALVAGIAAGVDVAEPLTHKNIKVLGLEYNLAWGDLDSLLDGGVLPLEYDPAYGYRVCQSISTWLVNDNYYRRELSVGRTGDYVARQVRDRLEQDFVGKKGTSTTLNSIKNATLSTLDLMYKADLLAGDSNNPPYKNVQVRLDGDICYVEFECSPVIPINYIPITIHLTVFTATLTA